MKKQLTALLLKYGITGGIGLAMTLSVLDLHGFSEAVSAMDRYRILSDAFTIPGVVILLCGVLVLVANEGAFEGISYTLSYAVRMLIPGLHRNPEKYRDYVERRREKGGVKGYAFLFITGAVFSAIAIVFIALFYTEYGN